MFSSCRWRIASWRGIRHVSRNTCPCTPEKAALARAHPDILPPPSSSQVRGKFEGHRCDGPKQFENCCLIGVDTCALVLRRLFRVRHATHQFTAVGMADVSWRQAVRTDERHAAVHGFASHALQSLALLLPSQHPNQIILDEACFGHVTVD